MGFWLSYVGIGFAGRAIPYFDDAKTLLFSLPVVVGTLLLPAVGLVSFVAARRWRYGPFFLVARARRRADHARRVPGGDAPATRAHVHL